jgi:hypothetical protein
MNFAPKTAVTRILVWLIWCIALLVFIQPTAWPSYQPDNPVPLLGAVSQSTTWAIVSTPRQANCASRAVRLAWR